MTDQLLRILLLLAATVVSCTGFSLVYGLRGKLIVYAVISSAISCLAYEVAYIFGCGLFLSAMIASALTAAYSDTMAHRIKVPATMMIIVGILPLVPGAKLYYTMLGAVQENMDMFYTNGEAALLIAAGLAVGIIAVTAVSKPINARISEYNQRKNKVR